MTHPLCYAPRAVLGLRGRALPLACRAVDRSRHICTRRDVPGDFPYGDFPYSDSRQRPRLTPNT